MIESARAVLRNLEKGADAEVLARRDRSGCGNAKAAHAGRLPGSGTVPLSRAEDAFGLALLDELEGRSRSELLLEVDDGFVTSAMPPAAFFLPADSWSPHEQEILQVVSAGPVLDLGAGAGRHTLHFQSLGYDVTAVDVSPGAIDVCKARGVLDARLQDLTDPPTDRRWTTVLLMCGNLGLAGGWHETRALLAKLASITDEGALIADTVDPTRLDDEHSIAHRRRNEAAGRHIGHARLRLRYHLTTTPWWDLLNVPVDDVKPLIDDTGWTIATHLIDTIDHYLVLRRQ